MVIFFIISFNKETAVAIDRYAAYHNRFIFLLFIIFWLIACSGPAAARADGMEVRVGVYENPPKVFTSASGKPSGIFIDIIEHMAREEGWRLRYVSGTWAEGLDRLSKGEIDLMPDVAYTSERENLFSFHQVPVLSSWSQIYAAKNSKIQSILDLDEKKSRHKTRHARTDGDRYKGPTSIRTGDP
jgi:ABC-type amino acid transport substrate-binding protein